MHIVLSTWLILFCLFVLFNKLKLCVRLLVMGLAFVIFSVLI